MATDVRHDPNWIIQNYMGSRNPAQHAIGQAMLENLARERAQGFSERELQERLAATRENLAENRALRQSTEQGRREDRQEREAALERARTDQMGRYALEDRDRQAQRLLAALPELQLSAGTDKAKAAQITKAVMDQYQQLTGLNFNLGGAPAQTPAQAALQRVAPGLGERVAQPTQGATTATGGTAAAAPPAGAAGTPPSGAPPTGTTPTFSPGAGLTEPQPQRISVGPQEISPPPGSPPGAFERAADIRANPELFQGPQLPDVQRNVSGGAVTGPLAAQVPPGYDVNFNTGRLVPQSSGPGLINGRPANTVLAEGALNTGVRPIYSPGAMNILDQLDQRAATQERVGQIPKPAGAGELVKPPEIPGEQPQVGAAATAPTPAAPGAPQRELVPADYIGHYLNVGLEKFANMFPNKPETTPGTPPLLIPQPSWMPAHLVNPQQPFPVAQQPPPKPPPDQGQPTQ